MSIFAILIMSLLGLLIGGGYGFVGEWSDGEEITHDLQKEAAKNCFQVAAFYAFFLGLSLLCCLANKRKGHPPDPRLS